MGKIKKGRYYHVVGQGYEPRTDILSPQEMYDRHGIVPDNKWGEDAIDGDMLTYSDSDVVCLFDNLQDAIDLLQSYSECEAIVPVALTREDFNLYLEDEHGVSINKEGYLCIGRFIPGGICLPPMTAEQAIAKLDMLLKKAK